MLGKRTCSGVGLKKLGYVLGIVFGFALKGNFLLVGIIYVQ